MPHLDIQRLRQQYSSLPVLTHHPNVIAHGKQVSNPDVYQKEAHRTHRANVRSHIR
jgi:hypothetical protein